MARGKRAWIILLIVCLALATGCNFPLLQPTPSPVSAGGGVAVAQPSPTASSTLAPPAEASPTVPPSTPTPAASPTLSPPMVSPIDKDVACRFGPGTAYSIEGALPVGHTVPILGRDSPGGWWYIENPSHAGWHCWVSSSATQTQGDTSIVAVQPPPVTFVEAVGVQMSPSSKDIPCGTFPYTFGVNFNIQYNGPITLTFQRILSDGHSAPPETYTYTASGTQSFSDSYRVGAAGSYWFKVQVTSPNKISGQGSAKMTCH